VIKLTKHQPAAAQVVIRVEGLVTAETIAAFHGMLGSERPAPSITLDLSGVTSVDAAGREFLVDLRRDGCRLMGASLYVKKLLEEA
jgi:anti-anti-sigma regulatory factor